MTVLYEWVVRDKATKGHWLDGHMTDGFLHGWIVPRFGHIQVVSVQSRRIQRPHGTYVALSVFQGILNGNNLYPTVNPNQ